MKPLEEFSDEHLNDRLQGLAKNLFLAEGKLFLPSHVSEVFHSTRTEILRRGPFPRLSVEEWIKPTDPMPIFHPKALVRYAKRQRLEELLSGVVWFGSARKYAELQNAAQRDDEVVRSWHAANTTFVIKDIPYPASDLVFRNGIERKDGGSIPYHSLSFSIEESPKLQRAFAAEGYVVIHDGEAFRKAITHALEAKIENCQWSSGGIRYYDDRTAPVWKDARDIAFSKSILFKYQHEFRITVFGPPIEQDWFRLDVEWPSGLFSEIRSF
jgi:hypothetical protein